jgi:V/A-type H+-transporting ATPase subunit D
MELMGRIEAAKRAQADVDEVMASAFAALREAALRSGTEALAREALGIVRRHKLDYRGRPVMGIELPTVTAEHEPPKLDFSTAAGSALSDDVMKRFTKVLDAIARLAEVENAVLRLASEVRRTQRRVNALDKIFIPDYKETVSYIEDVLEEREREQFVIMKMVKGTE